jgi:hypothetical protein
MLQLVNLALKFILELCALACVACWGFQQSDQLPLRVLFGTAAAVLFAVGWGVFLAPTAHSGLDLVSKNIIGGAVLLLAAVAPRGSGQRTRRWYTRSPSSSMPRCCSRSAISPSRPSLPHAPD